MYCDLSHYSSVQCHMILQKSLHVDQLLKKHVLLLSMLKTVVRFNTFVEMYVFFK